MYVTFAQLAFVSLVSVSFLSMLVGATAFLSIMRQVRISRPEVVPIFADVHLGQPLSATTLEHNQIDLVSKVRQQLRTSPGRIIPQQIITHIKPIKDGISKNQPVQRVINTIKHSFNLVVGRTKAG